MLTAHPFLSLVDAWRFPQFGETTTNIVVVQFSDNVQTSLDKRYNLTCTVVGPSESVVTSGYIGAG